MGTARKHGRIKAYIWLVMLAGFLQFGCEKHDLPDDLWGSVWKLEGFVTANGSWKANDEYNEIRFEFLDSSGIRIQLPVNECGADLLVFTGNRIQWGPMSCTEVCCDPEYAEGLKVVLSQVVSYYLKDKKLYLQGPRGSAIFKR